MTSLIVLRYVFLVTDCVNVISIVLWFMFFGNWLCKCYNCHTFIDNHCCILFVFCVILCYYHIVFWKKIIWLWSVNDVDYDYDLVIMFRYCRLWLSAVEHVSVVITWLLKFYWLWLIIIICCNQVMFFRVINY